MRNRRTLLIVCILAVCLPWDQPAAAQFGGNSGRSPDADKPRTTNTNPNDRRRSNTGTSIDDETSDEREARRNKGLEESVDKGAPPGISKGPEVVGQVDETAWSKPTAEQQAAVVVELKKFGEDARAKVNANLVLNETKYFLFYSDLRPAEAAKWSGLLDRMYVRLANLFGIKDGENLFRGKALVFVFAKEEDYQTFQKTMHETDAAGSAGLCHNFGNGNVHIGFFRQPNEMDFAAVLVHESVHGFLHRYRKPPSIPTWANEGLAETIASELIPQRGKRQELRQYAITQLRERGTLGSSFFTTDRLEGWQYPVAQMLTEFMIRQSKKNYIAFIDGMKDGLKWEDALAQKYGAPQGRLIAAFGNSLNIRDFGSPQPVQDRRRPGAGQEDPEERERTEERQ